MIEPTCRCGNCGVHALERYADRPGYQLCEWCGRYTGGALLCGPCESMTIWKVTESHGRNQRYPLDVPEPTGAVLRADEPTAGVSDGHGASVVGVNGVERGFNAVDRLPILREEQPAGRFVIWPTLHHKTLAQEWR